jgi:arginine deiminase
MVHRPDPSPRARLSPRNCQELLFDDVIWVRRAQEAFDASVAVMTGRGVQGLRFRDLLAETLERDDARGWVLERLLRPEEVTALLARGR